MRIDDVNKNALYREVRYNKNTVGIPEKIIQGICSENKRRIGAMNIFGIMSSLGYYDSARSETEGKNLKDILKRMISDAEERVEEKRVKI